MLVWRLSVCLTSVCLSRTSVLSRKQRGLFRKTKIGTEVRDYRTPLSRSKGQRKTYRERGHIVAVYRTACLISDSSLKINSEVKVWMARSGRILVNMRQQHAALQQEVWDNDVLSILQRKTLRTRLSIFRSLNSTRWLYCCLPRFSLATARFRIGLLICITDACIPTMKRSHDHTTIS